MRKKGWRTSRSGHHELEADGFGVVRLRDVRIYLLEQRMAMTTATNWYRTDKSGDDGLGVGRLVMSGSLTAGSISGEPEDRAVVGSKRR